MVTVDLKPFQCICLGACLVEYILLAVTSRSAACSVGRSTKMAPVVRGCSYCEFELLKLIFTLTVYPVFGEGKTCIA